MSRCSISFLFWSKKSIKTPQIRKRSNYLIFLVIFFSFFSSFYYFSLFLSNLSSSREKRRRSKRKVGRERERVDTQSLFPHLPSSLDSAFSLSRG